MATVVSDDNTTSHDDELYQFDSLRVSCIVFQNRWMLDRSGNEVLECIEFEMKWTCSLITPYEVLPSLRARADEESEESQIDSALQELTGMLRH